MPRPRFEKLPREKRDAILAAAAAEFAHHGYAGASVNRILDAAGISKGAFYYYFDDKEDLFLAVIDDGHRRAYDSLGEFPRVATPREFWAATGRFLRRMMRFAAAHPEALGLQRAFGAAVARGELKRPLREFQQSHYDFHRRFVAVGQEAGAVRTDLPDDLLFPLLESFEEAGDNWLAARFDGLGEGDREKLIRKFHRLYRRLLEPGPETKEKIR